MTKSKKLCTTTLLFNLKDSRQFGFVGCSSKPDKEGRLKILLNPKSIQYNSSEDELIIDMTEEQAKEFSSKISTSLIQMDHLRGLHKLGRLKDKK